jgi:hypothetical protein
MSSSGTLTLDGAMASFQWRVQNIQTKLEKTKILHQTNGHSDKLKQAMKKIMVSQFHFPDALYQSDKIAKELEKVWQLWPTRTHEN